LCDKELDFLWLTTLWQRRFYDKNNKATKFKVWGETGVSCLITRQHALLFLLKISSSTELDYFLLLQRKNVLDFLSITKTTIFYRVRLYVFWKNDSRYSNFLFNSFSARDVASPVFFWPKTFFTPADLTQGIVATPQGAGGRGPTNQKASGLQTCTHTHTHTYTHKHIKTFTHLHKHISTHTYTQKHIKTHTNTHKHLHQIFHVLRYLQSHTFQRL